MQVKTYKILSYIPLMILAGNFINILVSRNYVSGYIFLWFVLNTVFIDLIGKNSRFLKIVTEILLFLPIFMSASIAGKIETFLISAILLIMNIKDSEDIDRNRLIAKIQSYIILSVVIVFISQVIFGKYNSKQYIMPYAVLYLILSLVFIKVSRDKEYEIEKKTNMKMNIFYLFTFIVIAAIAVVIPIKNTVLNIIKKVVTFISIILCEITKVLNSIFWGAFQENKISPANVPSSNADITNKAALHQNNKILIISILMMIIITIILMKILNKKNDKEDNFGHYISESNKKAIITVLSFLFSMIISPLALSLSQGRLNLRNNYTPINVKGSFQDINKTNNHILLKNSSSPMGTAFIISAVIIIIIAVAVIIKLFKKLYNTENKFDDYVETKEIIKKNKGKSNFKKQYFYLKNGDSRTRIRYYYYKFMNDCIRNNIKINDYDTTLDISRKAQTLYKKENLENMRDIYLKAKYTDSDCTEDDFNNFYNSYENKIL